MNKSSSSTHVLRHTLVARRQGLEVFLPDALLAPWVQCICVAQQALPDELAGNKLYPDGGVSIRFTLSSQGVMAFAELHQHVTLAQSHELQASVVVRFHPGGAYQLLRLNTAELKNGSVPLSDLNLPHYHDLEQALLRLESASVLDVKALVEQWLSRQFVLFNHDKKALAMCCINLIFAKPMWMRLLRS